MYYRHPAIELLFILAFVAAGYGWGKSSIPKPTPDCLHIKSVYIGELKQSEVPK